MTTTLQNTNSRLGFLNLNYMTNLVDLFECISAKHINKVVQFCISTTIFINTCCRTERYIPSSRCYFFIPNTDFFSTNYPFVFSENVGVDKNTHKKQENVSHKAATSFLHSENISCTAATSFLHLEIVPRNAATSFLNNENVPCNAATAILRFERAFYSFLCSVTFKNQIIFNS